VLITILGAAPGVVVLAQALADIGHEVTVFGTSPEGEVTGPIRFSIDERELARADLFVLVPAEPINLASGGSPFGDLEALRSLVDRCAVIRETDGSASRIRLRELELAVERATGLLVDAKAAAQSAERSLESLRNRRSVRLALLVASALRPVIRALRAARRRRSAMAPRTTQPDIGHRPRSAEQVSLEIRKARSIEYPTSGLLVSIVVLTRDGADHLQRLLRSLASTKYRSFELIVVDNDSDDGTAALLDEPLPFPLRVVENDRNMSFSFGNNQGASIAKGDYLLFLNNDVESMLGHWLGAMVTALETPSHPSAVGALLVYPDRGHPESDLTVQHRGIGFGLRLGAPHAVNLAADDPADPTLVGISEVPAVTAAAMLIRKETFHAVGRFTLGYHYGAEDVDLCLRLRREGPILLQGDAVLLHHESATQRGLDSGSVKTRRDHNWQLFAETWGPAFRRSIMRDRLTGKGAWTGRPGRSAAITVTRDDPGRGHGDYFTAHELGAALAAQGWTVHYIEQHRDGWYQFPGDLDLLIVLIDAFDVRRAPRGVYTIAWVRNWLERWLERPWFESYDLVVASSSGAAQTIRIRTRFDPAVIPLATNPTRFHPAARQSAHTSDYVFTGNNWGRSRHLLDVLDVRRDERFHIFGARWGEVSEARGHWRGFVDYEQLPDVYRSTKVVLDDAAEPTIEHGFVNSRVFDALASGTLVLTNNQIGSEEVFDGLLPVYHDRESLRRSLDHYLEHEEERNELTENLRQVVLRDHTYERRATQFVDLALADIDRARVAVKIGAADLDRAPQWGDYHFAKSLIRSLRPHGIRGAVHLLPEWDAPDRQDADVVIHLRGLSAYDPKPSAINVLWLISHPDDVTTDECARYDLVCVASASLAAELERLIDTPILHLPQATDGGRFGAGIDDESLRTSVLFVGNSRNQHREVVAWAVESGIPLTVYGDGWDGRIPREIWKGRYFPNERLPDLYASAAIVLSDHWPDMRREGIVSNRVFDALAAGAFVISDRVAGIHELLEGAVPTFSSPSELVDLVDTYLSNPDARRELTERGRRLVLQKHTFDHRAATIVERIRPLLVGRLRNLEGDRLTFG